MANVTEAYEHAAWRYLHAVRDDVVYAEATIALKYSRRSAGIRPWSRTSVFAAPSARSRKAAS